MKKIAIVRYNLSKIGGAEKVAINMANELSQYYDVKLLSILLDEDGFINYDINPNVTLINFYKGDLRIRTATLKLTGKLREYIKREKIEVIFSITPLTNTMVRLATLGLNVKIVFCDHHSLEFRDFRSREVQRFVGAKFFDKIVTLTEEDRIKYSDKYNIPINKVNAIYNWIDEEDSENTPFDNKTNKIITVGRFHSQKGYDYLAEVAIKVLSQHPDWQWDIYGSGDKLIEQELKRKLEEGYVSSQVNFKENVKGTENIYPNHSIYVMTSRYEGLPLVLLEAQQYNLPIVSFRCPTGPSEIVEDRINGFLIDCYDVDQMSEKLLELMKNDDLRQSFSEHAKDNMDKFDKNKILNQWIELIETI
ncbi:glycosyltransferase family 4 protein [Streptococcus pneumoniae]|nr:glycosyltransferase family 4 protein [Streptococcus pneumoniae]MDS2606226.1 glycosyltransferase family 4 protein [Streptococcus pneumoniae]MDS2930826.1 glycosyltransferase family 4 protein [Streptococcus pneumoniae]MDS5258889.1 glycosyltransferase family 4 protein [Streptococcus pneumoniae]MDS8076163.1 glycosyltransferase family 4 protein [Streptococcus pneumoniae]